MAQSRDNPLNFDVLSWDTIVDYLKTNIQSKRSSPTEHWLELLNERVANSHRELARTTPVVNNYMKWLHARGKNIKAPSKTIPSSILGKHNQNVSAKFFVWNFQDRRLSKVN